jgi:hypothetical protein
MDMSIEGKEKTIKLLLYENQHWLFLDSRISYVGWLKKKKSKGYTSVVVDFLHPEDVNTSLDRGITWLRELKSYIIYNRECILV